MMSWFKKWFSVPGESLKGFISLNEFAHCLGTSGAAGATAFGMVVCQALLTNVTIIVKPEYVGIATALLVFLVRALTRFSQGPSVVNTVPTGTSDPVALVATHTAEIPTLIMPERPAAPTP